VKILLDTAPFLWVVLSPSRLSSLAARQYEDPLNEIYLSAASVYEVVGKTMLGKLDVGVPQVSSFGRNANLARFFRCQSTKKRPWPSNV
jgi:PIN domain nuclease of toxin-antitoxin system